MALAALLTGCAGDDPYRDQVRGHALPVAALTPTATAALYGEAARASFNEGTPLLLDPEYLPRTSGWIGGDPMPNEIATAIERAGVASGRCTPPPEQRAVPVCAAGQPGYVVRFSPVFRAPGDTVEVYLAVVKYRTAPNQSSEALRFEKAYRAVPAGSGWRITGEARMPAPR